MKRLLIASVCAAGLSLAACGDRTPETPADSAMDSAVDATATTEAGDGSAMSGDSAGSGGSSSRSGNSSGASNTGSTSGSSETMYQEAPAAASMSNGAMARAPGAETPDNEQVAGGPVAPGTPPPLPKGQIATYGPRDK